jgi:hypothetical protein
MDFFEKVLKTYIPKIHKHMQSLDISLSLYFFHWIEYIFLKTFPYHMLLRLWDLFLVRGEVFLYEIALGIIKIQEKDILNVKSTYKP